MLMSKEEAQIVVQRHERWASVFEPVTEGHVEVAILLKTQYFDTEVFEERYKGNTEQIKLYILMHRIYHFLFTCWFFDVKSQEELVAEQVEYSMWICELCERQAFRDVHYRQRHYYPQFAEYIDRHLETEGK